MKLILLALCCVAFTLVGMACTETATPTNTSTPLAGASPGSVASPASAASPAASADEFAHAREIYTKQCEACHGPNAEGGIAKVDNKQIKVPSLKSDHAVKHTDERLAKTITNGDEEMPAFKDKLKQDEIALMVRYIRTVVQAK